MTDLVAQLRDRTFPLDYRDRLLIADEVEQLRRKLDDMLAVIHHDGGHYQERYGDDKAYEDALQLLSLERSGSMEDKP